MTRNRKQQRIAVLASGGLDSSILIYHLQRSGYHVSPVYVQSGLVWEQQEQRALDRWLEVTVGGSVDDPRVLQVPVDDLYGQHWSLTGLNPPDADTDDRAVYLPGRNALLVLKSLLWCQLNGIERLALATLGTSPFPDATIGFFRQLQDVLGDYGDRSVTIELPFADFDKHAVMQLGRHLPLGQTFSCLSPEGDLHCGQCNKCAERQTAFREIRLSDPTPYAGKLCETR